MRCRLSPELQKLVKRNPLPSRAETDRVLKGDLEFGATRYSVEAASSPAAWAVYFAIEGENGRSFEQSIASLHPSVCADLARWGFDEGRESVGVVAYRRFLEMSKKRRGRACGAHRTGARRATSRAAGPVDPAAWSRLAGLSRREHPTARCSAQASPRARWVRPVPPPAR